MRGETMTTAVGVKLDDETHSHLTNLVADAINPTLLLSHEEIERAGTWIDSSQDAWRHYNESPKIYPAGSWGIYFVGCFVD
jgi:glucose-6-phosphate 1-dehydrogenase